MFFADHDTTCPRRAASRQTIHRSPPGASGSGQLREPRAARAPDQPRNLLALELARVDARVLEQGLLQMFRRGALPQREGRGRADAVRRVQLFVRLLDLGGLAVDEQFHTVNFGRTVVGDEDMRPVADLELFLADNFQRVGRPLVGEVGGGPSVVEVKIPAAINLVGVFHAREDRAGDILRLDLEPRAVGEGVFGVEISCVGQLHVRALGRLERLGRDLAWPPRRVRARVE